MDRADGARLRRCAYGAAKTLAVRPHARRVHASPLRARSASAVRSPGERFAASFPVGDMDRADGARLRRCAHGAAKTPAVRPHARRVHASPLERAPREIRSLIRRAIRRFVPARRHGQSGWCASQALRAWRGQTLAVRPHARCVHASPLRARPARNSFTHQASDSPLRSRSATWTERTVRVSGVARMARPNSGRAPTRAACSRVAAHIAPARAPYALTTSDSPLCSPARRRGRRASRLLQGRRIPKN